MFFENLENMIWDSLKKTLNSFEVPKSEKATTAKEINKLLKKHHRYIYWVSHWLGKIHSLRLLRPPKQI